MGLGARRCEAPQTTNVGGDHRSGRENEGTSQQQHPKMTMATALNVQNHWASVKLVSRNSVYSDSHGAIDARTCTVQGSIILMSCTVLINSVH